MSRVDSKPLFRALEQEFDIQDQQTVLRFLTASPDLLPFLLDAHPVIRRYFPDAPIVLKVVTDPEVVGKRELVAAIAPQIPPVVAVARFMEFLDDWWLEAQDRAPDKLTVTIEYR